MTIDMQRAERLGAAMEQLNFILDGADPQCEHTDSDTVEQAFPGLMATQTLCHFLASHSGWWTDLQLDLAGATIEKLAFNQQRADHKLENRQAAGGKAY